MTVRLTQYRWLITPRNMPRKAPMKLRIPAMITAALGEDFVETTSVSRIRAVMSPVGIIKDQRNRDNNDKEDRDVRHFLY